MNGSEKVVPGLAFVVSCLGVVRMLPGYYRRPVSCVWVCFVTCTCLYEKTNEEIGVCLGRGNSSRFEYRVSACPIAYQCLHVIAD